MTSEQAKAIANFRSNPFTSKTMWTIYVGQLALSVFGAQYLWMGGRASSVLLALIAGITALAMTGIVGLAWTDPAVNAVRAFAGKKDSA